MNLHKTRLALAFSRTDLCAVLATGFALGLLILPMLGHGQTADWRTVCVRHLGLLAKAMAMYAADNLEYLPPNPDDGNTTRGRNWCPGIAGIGGWDEFNADLLLDPNRSLLITYVNNDVRTFKCPVDDRHGSYTGSVDVVPSKIGKNVPAARSVSLNGAVGTDPSVTGGKAATAGPWLNGQHSHTANSVYRCYGSLNDFLRPGPAATFTFLEEDPYSLNDAAFGCMGPNPKLPSLMIDWPSTLHGMAGGVAFADGHVEMHRWVDQRTMVYRYTVNISTQLNNPDLDWLRQRCSAPAKSQ